VEASESTTSSDVSVSTTEIPGLPGSTVMTGSIRLMVMNINAFLTDRVAQRAIAEGIAAAFGVKSSHVTVFLRSPRRLDEATSFRKLAMTGGDVVMLDYTVVIPPSASDEEKAAAKKDPALQDLKEQIQFKVAAATGLSVDVQSKTSPSVGTISYVNTAVRVEVVGGCSNYVISGLVMLIVSVLSV